MRLFMTSMPNFVIGEVIGENQSLLAPLHPVSGITHLIVGQDIPMLSDPDWSAGTLPVVTSGSSKIIFRCGWFWLFLFYIYVNGRP
jgi:hypothetical protein